MAGRQARVHWLCGLLALSAACGGKSSSDGGEPGPRAGGFGGATSECPLQRPTEHSACNYDNEPGYCKYPSASDECSVSNFECFQHLWFEVPMTEEPRFSCDVFDVPNVPSNGDSCKCFGKLSCVYRDCAARGMILARCDNATWNVADAPCEDVPCGPSMYCSGADICVIRAGFPAQFSCAPNPCSSGYPKCECAAQLCEASEVCSIDSGSVVCAAPE
jgi:hypothetical protein